MKILALLLIGVVASLEARTVGRDPTWKVQSEGADHITYVRNEVPTPTTTTEKDCNTTTTTPAPPRRRVNKDFLRSRTRPIVSKIKAENEDDGSGGHVWVVGGKSDDHITYVRRKHGESDTNNYGQLRRLGSGSDSVLARVVQTSDNSLTEERLVTGGGHKTQDLVHPYVKKSGGGGGWGARRLGTKNLQRPRPTRTTTTTTTAAPEYPPLVGDVVNGWVVVSKSKDHISWRRWGIPESDATPKSSQLRPKSLKTLNTERKPIPNYEGQLVDGFPRVFNTYSPSFFSDNKNYDVVGTIRTTLSQTENWKVGDELSGWRVISKDARGLVWEKISNDPKPNTDQDNSVSDSSSDSESNEVVEEEEYVHAPGVWYLSEETRDKITWSRDNVPDDVVFDYNAYPRVGDTQSDWRVLSKSREHITWERI